MAQTMTEKIFSEHAGREVHAGEIVRVDIDMIIGNDITTPISIRAFEESGAETHVHMVHWVRFQQVWEVQTLPLL